MAVLSEGQLDSDVTMTVVVYIKNFTSQILASLPGDQLLEITKLSI